MNKMLTIFNSIASNEELMETCYPDPFQKAVFVALHNYVKAGYKLSALSWFESLNLEVIEN